MTTARHYLALFTASAMLAIAREAALAQEREGARPAPIVSPEVRESTVTFRLSAPKAAQVKLAVSGVKDAPEMVKDERGVWSATVENLAPDIYEYRFEVDGLSVIDPSNPLVKSGLRPSSSLAEVRGNPPAFFASRDVPHGAVTMHTFQSKATGEARTFRVYTPPDYDRQTDARFPVLFLLHGSGDQDDGWTAIGHAHLIADNLIAEAKAKPLLIVMPNGSYPRQPGVESDQSGFETDVFEVIAPMVEARYRVAPGAANHAMAGLSMGGSQVLRVGIKHPDQFASFGVFSAGINDAYAGTHGPFLDAAKDKLALLWIACGEADKARAGAQKLETLLTERGVKFATNITPGGHTWSNWRNYLRDFLPLLFQGREK